MFTAALLFVVYAVGVSVAYVLGYMHGRREQAVADLRKRDARGRYVKQTTDHDQVRASFGSDQF